MKHMVDSFGFFIVLFRNPLRFLLNSRGKYYEITKQVETPQSVLILITILLISTLKMVYHVSNELQEIFSFLIVHSR